jgi:hypothetical protein
MASERKSRRAQQPSQARKAAAGGARKAARGAARGRQGGGLLGLDSEQSARLLLIGGVGLLVVLALGFVAFGWYWTEKRPLGRTVLQVDQYKVTFAAMKRRMNYELFINASLQSDPTNLPTVAYDNLLAELVKVARAGTLGVGLDEGTFDEKLRSRIGIPTGTDQRTYQDALRRQLDATGLTEYEYKRLVLADALETAIKEKFTAELPATVLQARIEVISAPTLEDAQKSIERINAGEAFADVAKSISQETDVQTTGGLHEYTPDGNFNPAYNDYAFSAEIGKLSDPLPAATGSGTNYIVRVLDRSEQPVLENQKSGMAQTKYDDWLVSTEGELESSGALVNRWDETAKMDALTAVYNAALPRLRQQAQQRQEQLQEQQNAQATAAALTTASPADGTPAPMETAAADVTAPAEAATPAADGGNAPGGP